MRNHSKKSSLFSPHRNRHKQRDAEDGIMTRDRIVLPLGLPSPPDGYNICCLNPRHIHQPALFLFVFFEIDGQFSNAESKKGSFTFYSEEERVGDPVEVDDPLSVYMMDHLMLNKIRTGVCCLYTLVIT